MFFIGIGVFMVYDRVERDRLAEKKRTEGKKIHEARSIFGFYDSIFPNELRAGSWYLILWNQLKVCSMHRCIDA
jgi:hypothetical protein